jgi:superfamily I DNA and/or RNA helicase
VGVVCKILKDELQKACHALANHKANPGISIGVITPYSEQQKFINDLLKTKRSELFRAFIPSFTFKIPSSLLSALPHITVSTVDSYQGQERDIILISTVRSNNQRHVGFLHDERRINVALTRAKYCLISVGSSFTLKNNEGWRKYLEWVGHNGTNFRYAPNVSHHTFDSPSAGGRVCNSLEKLIKSMFFIKS